MTREEYKAIWVKGLYGSQNKFPGDPMTLQDARKELKTIARHPDQYLEPPEEMTAEELRDAWNAAHKEAIAWHRERQA